MDTLIQEYLTAKQELDHFKALEAKLRIELLDKCFPTSDIGANNLNYGPFKIKGTFKNTFSVNANTLSEILADLSAEERDCISFKPSLIMSKYNACTQTEGLDEAITVKPAMPSLSITLNEEEI